MITVGIIGGTGYTGVELLRLLAMHPQVDIRIITSRSEAGVAVADMYPSLRGHLDLVFTEPNIQELLACDLVFFATPNGIAMTQIEALLEGGVKVIDLAADFRLKDIAVWEQWYGMKHACPDVVSQAVYGMPELNREQIRTAQVVANPGCYVTAVTLGYAPLIKAGIVDVSRLIADCKSGTSGAGRGAATPMLMAETGESFKAYATGGHRHLPEIVQNLNTLMPDNTSVNMTFTPHLVPMIRGIHATLYAELNDLDVDVQKLYESYYEQESFVDVMPIGSQPETRSVRGSNMCRIAIHRPQNSNTLVILSVIDNLMKGAAGQALHNMNLMFGFDEKEGLQQVSLSP